MSTNKKNIKKKLKVPHDILVIKSMLVHMGIRSCESKVVSTLLQFLYKYLTVVLQEANVMKDHAKKEKLDVDDIKFVLSSKRLFHNIQREEITALAKTLNERNLNILRRRNGLRIPPEHYNTTSCNYKLKTIKQIYLQHMYNQYQQNTQSMAKHKQSMLQRAASYSQMNNFPSVLKTSNVFVRNQLSPYISFNEVLEGKDRNNYVFKH